jgi:hypothetical protein
MTPQGKLILDSVTGAGSATNAGTFTSANIDTLGYDFVTIDVSATTQSASTQAGSPSVLKIQESDTTVASTFADVVGFRGASATATNVDFVVGVGKTSGVNAYKFNVDARKRKRYLNPGHLADHDADLPGQRQPSGPSRRRSPRRRPA